MTTTILAGLVGAVGLFLVVWSTGRKRAEREDALGLRLRVYDQPDDPHETELQKPFSERVVAPAVARLRGLLASRTPEKTRQALSHQLNLAGRPANLSAEDFQVIRYAAAVVLLFAGLLAGTLLHNEMVLLIGMGVGAAAGFYGPKMWLRQKVDGRRKEIQLALPDAMDLLTITVEAGLGFEAATMRLTEKVNNALAEEFETVMAEVRLGRPRLEALDDMGRRCGVEDLHNFVQAVIQSEQMGIGVARILRLQSDEMRRKRKQKAQEKAAQATLKMMLPMVGCIFPTIWIVLLGPAILILLKARG
jgi:tight adherence protein C